MKTNAHTLGVAVILLLAFSLLACDLGSILGGMTPSISRLTATPQPGTGASVVQASITPSPPTIMQPSATVAAAGIGTFKSLTFAVGIMGAGSNLKPVDPMTRFPEGITKVYEVLTYEGILKGSQWRWERYLDGKLQPDLSGTGWDLSDAGVTWLAVSNPAGIIPGEYELRLFVADKLVQKGAYVVEKRAANTPYFGPIQFAEGIKDGQPVNAHKPLDNFKVGTKEVYAFSTGGNIPKGTKWRTEWWMNGALGDWGKNPDSTWDPEKSPLISSRLFNEKGLFPGTYGFKIYIEGKVVQLGSLIVEGAPPTLPAPSPAVTLPARTLTATLPARSPQPTLASPTPRAAVPMMTPASSARGWTAYEATGSQTALVFDRDGNLWAGGFRGGVVKYNATGGTFRRYTTQDGLASNSITSVALGRDGTVWFGNNLDGGVSRFDGKSWLAYRDVTFVNDIAVAPDGALWFASGLTGLVRFDGATWTKYGDRYAPVKQSANSVAVTPEGVVWVGTALNGVTRFDGSTWKSYSKKDGLADDTVNAIAVSPQGTLWFGTQNGGISRFDGSTWTTYTEKNGLPNNRVNAISITSNGMVWVGTAGGAARFDGRTWTKFSDKDGLTGTLVVSSAVAPDGAVCFGTDKGISCFDGKTWTARTANDAPSFSGNTVAIGPDGTLWVSERRAVSRFDGKTWTTYVASIGNVPVIDATLTMRVAADGALWVPSADPGVFRFDGNTWTHYAPKGILTSFYIQSVAPSKDGTVWVGGTSSQLARFDGRAWTNYEDSYHYISGSVLVASPDGSIWASAPESTRCGNGVSRFDGKNWITYTVKDGLASNKVSAIATAPDGTVWVASKSFLSEGCGTGISRFDGKTWTTFGKKDGLQSEDLTSLAVGHDGALWVGTSQNGVLHFDGKTWSNYTQRDGLTDDTVHSIAIAPDGSVWIAGNYGVSHYVPK